MTATLDALGPIFLLVLLGFALQRWQFPGDGFWPLAERFTYYLLFPALLIHNLAPAHFAGVAVSDIVLLVVTMLLVATAMLVAVRHWVSATPAAFTSFYQGGIRFNTYVGLAAVNQLYGDQGMVVAAVTIAIMIPLINVLCVLIFAFYGGQGEKVSWGATAMQIARNPLILGCVIGVLLNVSGIGLPFWSRPALGILSQAALPVGLLAVGFALNLRALRGAIAPLGWACVAKFLALPLVALMLARIWGAEPLVTQVLILFAALPTASSSYILARQMGGDAPLMAGIITAQTLLAMATLPITLMLYPLLGLSLGTG
ncbi:AEC family transporter [Pokkaliibacter plantistimulans]|uniref:AEC family transporter n=1 Tax=Proteobacteria bacterium 228 TaxID=2083153 RepID=A0A2S5KKX1_9PROT|nr:AEC family transporter [Pokkaliibacter plantistimulans]PPC75285.1 AEC family transporter [Pokkaliibacter plantistimulans]